MDSSLFRSGKDTEVVLTSTVLEAGNELHVTTDEATTQVPGSAQVCRASMPLSLTSS